MFSNNVEKQFYTSLKHMNEHVEQQKREIISKDHLDSQPGGTWSPLLEEPARALKSPLPS